MSLLAVWPLWVCVLWFVVLLVSSAAGVYLGLTLHFVGEQF